jgi:hypothetical protein
MQKPLAYDRQGLAIDKSSTSVPQSASTNQVFLKISRYISSGCFTHAIDLLEKRGITGDVAIFIIATLQAIGGEK